VRSVLRTRLTSVAEAIGVVEKRESRYAGLARRAALGLAAARVGLGAAAIVMPGRALRPWIGEDSGRLGSAVIGRALGGRDIALGLGSLMAARKGTPIRGWTEAAALSDLIDTAATAVSFGKLPSGGRWLVLASSAGAAAVGVTSARFL